MDFASESKKIEPYLLEIRRSVHAHPELSLHEKRTAALVREQLERMDIELLPADWGHSVAALIRGALPGKTVALRAELDALPIEEETQLPWKSVNAGVMHACGHDVHLACLLGAARMLAEKRERLQGNVLLLFQSAEETASGAKAMLEAGVLELGPEAIFGLHTNTGLDVGKVALARGASQAGFDLFRIEIQGRGGHGAFPHTTVDPIVAAAWLITQLQTPVSRNLDPLSPGLISVGRICAGSSPNTIPERAELEGTVRSMGRETRELLLGRMEDICAGVERSFGCRCSLSFGSSLPTLVNDAALAAQAAESCAAIVGRENVLDLAPAMVSDDMACFTELIPGVLAALGVRNEAKGIVCGNHNPRFDVDEDCLWVGAACMAQMAWDHLCNKGEIK